MSFRASLSEINNYRIDRFLNNHPIFNWFISDKDLMVALHQIGVSVPRGYLVDDDYLKWVFKDVTYEDALFIAEKLIRESGKGWCSKGNYIKSCLVNHKKDHKFWSTNPASLLSYVRRINCICHETCSLSKRRD